MCSKWHIMSPKIQSDSWNVWFCFYLFIWKTLWCFNLERCQTNRLYIHSYATGINIYVMYENCMFNQNINWKHKLVMSYGSTHYRLLLPCENLPFINKIITWEYLNHDFIFDSLIPNWILLNADCTWLRYFYIIVSCDCSVLCAIWCTRITLASFVKSCWQIFILQLSYANAV